MSLVCCDGGKQALLQALVSTLNGYVLRLFVNNHTPASTDTASSYTEASFPGYAAINLTHFGSAFLTTDTPKRAETDEVVETFTQTTVPSSPQTVYGYYVTDGSGNLIWSELGPSGGTLMNSAGQTYSVLAKMQLTNVGG